MNTFKERGWKFWRVREVTDGTLIAQYSLYNGDKLDLVATLHNNSNHVFFYC